MSFLKSKKLVIILVLTAIASFFFWNWPVFSYTNLQSDSNYYDRVAVNFQNGFGFTDAGQFQNYTIGYETFLATVYTFLGHNPNVVRLVQGVLFVLIILLIFYFGERFFGQKTAFWTALFSSIFYVLPISAGVIGKETLSAFLILIFLFFFLGWRDDRRIVSAVFAGFFLGALALTLPIMKYFFIPFFIALIWVEWKNVLARRTLLGVVLIFLLYAVTVSPSFILPLRYESSLGLADQGGGLYARAEYMNNLTNPVPGHFIGMTIGYYFAQKLYPSINAMAFREVPVTDQFSLDLKKQGLVEYEAQNVMFRQGLNKILDRPDKYLFVTFLDFICFNSPLVPHGEYRDLNFIQLTFADGRHPEVPSILKTGYLLTMRFLWYIFIGFVIYGIVLLWRKQQVALVFLLLLILYLNGTYSFVHAIPRYAIPIYPLYFILASGATGYIILKIHDFRTKKTSDSYSGF